MITLSHTCDAIEEYDPSKYQALPDSTLKVGHISPMLFLPNVSNFDELEIVLSDSKVVQFTLKSFNIGIYYIQSLKIKISERMFCFGGIG